MPDREKVMKGLECCINVDCTSCLYLHKPFCSRTIMSDALALLKEQEVIAPMVHCCECKYGEPEINGIGQNVVMCQNKQNPIGFGNWWMPLNWYCADGKRKDACYPSES